MVPEKSCFMFLLVSFLGITNFSAKTIIAENITDSYVSLKNEIFNRSVIKHKIPLDASRHKDIIIDFIPFQILSVDEINQFVCLSSLIMVTWTFDQLVWDSEEYNDIDNLFVDLDKVWTPQIALPKERESKLLELPKVITLSPKGFMAIIPTSVTTTCKLDLYNFPFDSHNCSIVFVELHDYNLMPSPTRMTDFSLEQYFSTSTEWIFVDSGCDSFRRHGEFHYTECWFTMKRRSLFYILGVFAPILIISFMTHFVFVIPVESGEKISFMVSIFVSMTIFISYINGIIPRSMDQIPRIILLLGAILLNMVLCMLASFFVINRYHSDLNRRQQKHAEEKRQGYLDERQRTTCSHIEVHHNDANSNSIYNGSKISSNHNPIHSMDLNGRVNQEECEASNLAASTRTMTQSINKCCGKLTCFQLDKIFFVIFLITSLLTYYTIISLSV